MELLHLNILQNTSHDMRWLFKWLILLLIQPAIEAIKELDNSLVSEPEISCNADTIEMRFRTKHRFTGKIYVQGHYHNPECRVDYSQTTTDGNPIGGIRLHHGACDMDRQRMIQSNGLGMQFSAVLMISFHPLFVTKADRAYHINCLYREVEQPVTASLDVSEVPTIQLARDVPLPTCQYTIRKDEIDGQILRYANVGDQVVHRWECNSKEHGVLVHNCFVEDGQGEKRMVIDERGCHVDSAVLGDPTYVKDLNMAYRESSVFKFADKIGVRFLCEIKLCLKVDGGCEGITPPNCDLDRSFQDDRASDEWQIEPNNETIAEQEEYHSPKILSKQKRSAGNQNSSQFNTVSTDLISQYVYVLDTSDDPHELSRLNNVGQSSPQSLDLWNSQRPSICLSPSTLIAIFILVVLSFTIATAVVLNALMQRHRVKQLPMEPPRHRINPTTLMFR
ncbi:Zona pellucida domain-containing protein [Aphelenchoides besseyi]|nr:Zona pellucida domain-containing protein [Aphelenchoides besseyi]